MKILRFWRIFAAVSRADEASFDRIPDFIAESSTPSPASNVCAENSIVKLDDKTIKVLYNASAYEKEKDPLIRSFLHFIYTNKPGEDDFSRRLSRLVNDYKKDEESRSDYLAMNLHDHDIRYEALAVGAQQKAKEAAIKMLKKKYPTSDISEISGLPLEQVLELQKTIAIQV